MRRFDYYGISLPLKRPFVISRGTSTSVHVVRVRVEEDGHVGIGECTPTLRYQETVDSVLENLDAVAQEVSHGLARDELQIRLPAGSARNALDCALWDLECRLRSTSLWSATGVPRVEQIVTAQTVSIGTPAAMASFATKAVKSGVSLLKLKLDNSNPIQRVRAVRNAVPRARIIADANEAWRNDELRTRCHDLATLGVEMLEQPLPAAEDRALGSFSHPLPICADESCHTQRDIAQIAERYDMVNIKLDKTGGLTEALALAACAKEEKLGLMVGCMLGSSIAMRAALPIAAQASLVDLDGPTWLADDSTNPLTYSHGTIMIQ